MGEKRILVVDDELEITDYLKEYLQLRGVEVSTASDGERAIELASKENPDLMLLDIKMGEGISGIEVLRRIKTQQPNLPIIMVTAAEDKNMSEMAKGLGAADYITKPFILEDLERVIFSRLQV